MEEASKCLKENNDNKFILESCYKDLDRLIDRVENKVEIILKDGNIPATEMEQLDDETHFATKLKHKIGRRLGDLNIASEARRNYPRISFPTFSGSALEFGEFIRTFDRLLAHESEENKTITD